MLGCASVIDRIGTTHLRPLTIVAGSTVAVSVGIDVLVLGIHPTWYGKPLAVRGPAQVPSPTLLRIPRSWDPVVLLVGFHAVAALLLLLVTWRPVGIARTRRQIVTAASVGMMAVVVTFGTVTTHLEMLSRSSAEWHWVTNSTYRVEAFRQCCTCIEKLADVNDPGVRGVGDRGWLLSDSSWPGLGEPVGTSARRNMIGPAHAFQLSRFLLLSPACNDVFFGRLQQPAPLPPLTDDVAEKVSSPRLLGVRYVGVAQTPRCRNTPRRRATSPCWVAHFWATVTQWRGRRPCNCRSTAGAATSYVYVVARSPGIFPIPARRNEVMSQATARWLRASTLWTRHGRRGVVWTEQPEASATATPMQRSDEERSAGPLGRRNRTNVAAAVAQWRW